ncbi:NADH dehydrogenase subunit E [Pseudoruegeria aquimaris]|uniref:NADH dehydrogenase subunit E n=1 Tax=Pseudoruegeria aquimaris TaxID=393663 RepID=A0A1Y5SQN5_9RHOB|nr:hypothetical protein [Pseudoruegeria aquimaris]SLN44833.1 NADH dehydrogenase subunit E [Pseudoruegeria aquimaris]
MTERTRGNPLKYWAIALVAGAVVWLLLGDVAGVAAGLVVFLLTGLVLGRLFAGPAGETAAADALREAGEAAESALADARSEAQAEAEDAAVLDAVRSQIEPDAPEVPEPALQEAAEAPAVDVAGDVAADPEDAVQGAPEPVESAKVEAAQAPASNGGSTLLSGEEELAARKGSWRYEKPAAEAPAQADGDDGSSELLKIDGITSALVSRLEAAGITRLEQLASLDDAGVEALTEALALKRKGRITRQRWVEQARELTGKGTTG